jgi:cytochrome c heme-lyase
MGWWKADPSPQSPASPPQASSPPPTTLTPPHSIPAQAPSSADTCPVDPQTRQIWLRHAQAQEARQAQLPSQVEASPSITSLPHPISPSPQQQQPLPSISSTALSKECSSDRISQTSSTTSPSSAYTTSRPLSHSRVVSTIPRALTQEVAAIPANAESETGPHSSGNWIYPSEHQFFHAVMRKSTLNTSTPEDLASSISSIIPIHNAVNERAWHLIRQWEAPVTNSQKATDRRCQGPKLLKFEGLGAGAKSMKARVNGILGYTEPFDRHDWTVERCDGSKVEYVIDFYQGRAPTTGPPAAGKGKGGMDPANLNFYLDVRPKLNSMEGWRMRAERMVGWRYKD